MKNFFYKMLNTQVVWGVIIFIIALLGIRLAEFHKSVITIDSFYLGEGLDESKLKNLEYSQSYEHLPEEDETSSLEEIPENMEDSNTDIFIGYKKNSILYFKNKKIEKIEVFCSNMDVSKASQIDVNGISCGSKINDVLLQFKNELEICFENLIVKKENLNFKISNDVVTSIELDKKLPSCDHLYQGKIIEDEFVKQKTINESKALPSSDIKKNLKGITKISAACLILAAQTYSVPPAILLGIYKVEGGMVGQAVGPNDNGSYDLGPMQINTSWIPELAEKWGVSQDEAYHYVRDDPCSNMGVTAWILNNQIYETGSLNKAIRNYYKLNKDSSDKNADSYLEAVKYHMRAAGLVRDSNEVELIKNNLTHEVSVLINNKVELDFIIDSGASLVSVPLEVFLTLVRTKTVSESDILPSAFFRLANGQEIEQERFIIRELKVGNHVVKDVEATVSEASSPLLLGQSYLKKFSSITIDNMNNKIILKNDSKK